MTLLLAPCFEASLGFSHFSFFITNVSLHSRSHTVQLSRLRFEDVATTVVFQVLFLGQQYHLGTAGDAHFQASPWTYLLRDFGGGTHSLV